MKNLLGEQIEQVEVVEQKKGQYDWRYENSINTTKEYYVVEGPQVEHKYVPWRTNKSLSNYPDTVMDAAIMNMSAHLDPQLQFDYYFYAIRRKKRFFKRPKIDKDADFHLIQECYKYNNRKTEEALRILTSDQIKIIEKKQEKGGTR